jgi:hypothetical protein
MHKYIFLVIIPFVLTSCFAIQTNTSYNHSLTKSKSESDRIFLTFADTKHASFSFVLLSSNQRGHTHDTLKVRWINPDRYVSQFDGLKSTIKFLIDNEDIITLHPLKEPVFVSYNLETKSTEEEISFLISRDNLTKIATAKDVKVELSGKHRIVNARFNRWHTFKAFKNFVENS